MTAIQINLIYYVNIFEIFKLLVLLVNGIDMNRDI